MSNDGKVVAGKCVHPSRIIYYPEFYSAERTAYVGACCGVAKPMQSDGEECVLRGGCGSIEH